MQTISRTWFDKEAKEAAQLYTSIFKDSAIRIRQRFTYSSGTVDLLNH